MARIDVLPSVEIIRGLKGILDFYVWRGLPCVRAWPKYRPARQTPASLAAALVFGAIIKAYNLLGNLPLEAYQSDALDQPRTARDIMVTGVFGNLHEASMSDFLTLLTQCRDFLSDLTALLNALDSIDTDELVVNVDQSVLPPLAATTTNQATAITALQKIDDLQDALESKALDRFLVRGMDQLFSYAGPYYQQIFQPNAALGNNELLGTTPPASEIWVVTSLCAFNATNPCTYAGIGRKRAGTQYHTLQKAARATLQGTNWSGHLALQNGDQAYALLGGCTAGDDLYFTINGFKMTLET